MRKIEIELDDHILDTLEAFASRQKKGVTEFLSWGVSNYTQGFVAMVLGEDAS